MSKNHGMHFLIVMFIASMAHAADRVTVYLDNANGNDTFDGLAATHAGNRGPVASLERAMELLPSSGTLHINNTGTPYRGSIKLVGKGGTPVLPLIVEGNGSIIEGLAATNPDDWKKEADDVISIQWDANWGFFVVADDAPPQWGKSATELQPGESFGDYQAHRGYYRLPKGASLGQIQLETPQGFSGVVIYESSNIIIRNLHARYFWNDGFNLGGKSENLRFENIEASMNGDEGISAHNDISAYVTDGQFHHNDNGICDTGFSRTAYQRAWIHDNRSAGAWFLGGEHSLVDAKLWNNPYGICAEPMSPTPLPGSRMHPYAQARLLLRNVWVKDGDYGLKLYYGSSAAVEHSTFTGQKTGFVLEHADSKLHLTNSIIAPTELAISSSGQYAGDYNCWSSSTATIQGESVHWNEWSRKNEWELHSIFAEPRLATGDSIGLAADSPARGSAFVDEEHFKWLGTSSLVDPDNPPLPNRDMGAADWEESPAAR
jgi:hypothetical protein